MSRRGRRSAQSDSFHVAATGEDGLVLTWVTQASAEGLVKQLQSIKGRVARIVYESGPTGFKLARVLERAGFPVAVVAASRIPRPATRGAKTDRLDCRRLAEYAAKGMLKPIVVPSEDEEAERSVLRLRHQVLDDLRKTKQRIKAFLLFHGFAEPEGLRSWSLAAKKQLLELQLHPDLEFVLHTLLEELDTQEGFLMHINSRLKILAGKEKHTKALSHMCSVPGVGPITAMAFRLEVFRPHRFKRSEDLTSFLGLAPSVRQSGESTHGGGIMPSGQRRLRSLLIEAAWGWCRRDPSAANRYAKLLGRTGVAQKAITAMARRLAIILWRLCVEQRCYRMAT